MEKIKLGIIGVGSVVREIYQYLYYKSAYSDLLEIVAIADINEEYRNWFGNKYGIKEKFRFVSYRDMITECDLDAVHINTPDDLHFEPVLYSLKNGLDVQIPKPTATSIKEVHEMISVAKQHKRYFGVDFHKRDDPRLIELKNRYKSGRYGELQIADWWMVDALKVSDPNYTPRFFASPTFSSDNTPASFLTVHMIDSLMMVVNLKPTFVQAFGYSQKMPSLKPISVSGYDLIDTTVTFENNALAHIITGWHLPNSAPDLTVQSSRMICTDGWIDIPVDNGGFVEIHNEGHLWSNPLFRTFEDNGNVSGFGITYPGKIFESILKFRNGKISNEDYMNKLNPFETGFYATLVLQGIEESLKAPLRENNGVKIGKEIDLMELIFNEIGEKGLDLY